MSGICGIFLPLLGSLLGQPREQFAWHLHHECVALIEPAGCKSCPMAVPGREYVQRQACNSEKSTPINYFVGGLLLVRPVDFPNTASGSIGRAASRQQRGSPSHDAVRLGFVVFSGMCSAAASCQSAKVRCLPAVLHPGEQLHFDESRRMLPIPWHA